MRVTQRTMQDSWIQNLQKRLGEMDRLNQQIGSGKRVGAPSDDPSAAGRIVRIEDVVARNEQYLKNIDTAISIQANTESALNQVSDRLVRAKSLAVEGANTASDPSSGSLRAMAEEVAGIRAAVLQMAGSTYQGQYLFSGTAAGVAPFDEETGAYLGDAGVVRVNLGNGQSVEVTVPGDRAFRESEVRAPDPLPASLDLTATPLRFTLRDGASSPAVPITLDGDYTPATGVADAINLQIRQFEQAHGIDVNVEAAVAEDGALSLRIAETGRSGEIHLEDDPASPGALETVLGVTPGVKNIFGVLDDLQDALETGDSERVGRMLGRMDRALADVYGERGRLGSRQRNLEFARERIQDYSVNSQTLREQLEGVDLPEAVTRISAEEQAYQTALASGARIFNVSIIDFLR